MGAGEPERQIALEQAVVGGLYARLDELRERAADSLERLRRAPVVPTPAGRAERDAFDALYTERLTTLRAVEERLCFGRMDMAAVDGVSERRYVGRLGMSDDDQLQLLIDWRAPAAAAFYQATAAAPNGVARRRQIATRGRSVTGVDDEILDDSGLDDDTRQSVTGEGALMSALTARRTGQMRDIVATLQAEQDAIVRAPMSGVLVVQGGPGTGKTVVALHRAAYLLYTYRERIARSGVLVVGPSPVFLRYIEQVLPSLGETGVLLSTPGQLFPGVDASGPERPEVVAVKGDLRMARVLRNAVRDRQLALDAPVKLSLDGDGLTLSPRLVADARGRARQTGRPHNEARTTFVRHVLDDLTRQLARARRIDPDEETRLELQAELRESVDVRREINLRWMPLSATGFLATLLSSPTRLRAAAAGVLKPAEIDALVRPPGSPWTLADVPLLDEVAELIGADVTSSVRDARAAAAAAAERQEALEHARRVLESAGEAGSMISAEQLADRFAGSGPTMTVAERARDDRTWTFGHVVLDEAQEASPMLWRLLARRVPSRSMTVVGDLAQTGSAAGASSWEEMLDGVARDRWELRELSVNYRTPGLIIRPATEMLRAAGVPVRPARAAREGEWAPVLVAVPDAGYAQAAAHALRDDDALLPGGRFAVVTPRGLDGSLGAEVLAQLAPELAERVSVLDVDAAKGLEYDTVVVVEPAAIVEGSARGVNDLYVALTRPTQRLTVLHARPLPPGLA
ncbi:HelD family protein [Spongisporangium articulatum]|uniref:HelD family protein n=1 Tax=Spongisporangium articulatum TaxID=3362603 RepID=A0ABW8AIN6_9ACTN